MEKIAWIIVLVCVFLVIVFLFGTFVLLYRSRKRLLLEKHHDDIVEENIAVLYSEYQERGKEKDSSFSAFLHRKRKRRKVLDILLDVVLGLATLLMLALLAAAIAYRHTGGQLYINGTAFYVVETDSMSEKNPQNEYLEGHDDQIAAHSFILLEKLEEDENLVPYEIYAYMDEEGQVIVHRYVSLMEDGTYLFRGDKNSSPLESDVGVERNQIIGRYNGYQNLPLGETISFLKSPIGMIVLVGLIAVFLGQAVYSEKLDRLYRLRYESLIPFAEEIHAKYVVLDQDRRKEALLLRKIALYPVGSVFLVLRGNAFVSTGERVEIVEEEDTTCLCRLLSDVNPYPSLPIRIAKDNLAADRPDEAA